MSDFKLNSLNIPYWNTKIYITSFERWYKLYDFSSLKWCNYFFTPIVLCTTGQDALSFFSFFMWYICKISWKLRRSLLKGASQARPPSKENSYDKEVIYYKLRFVYLSITSRKFFNMFKDTKREVISVINLNFFFC